MGNCSFKQDGGLEFSEQGASKLYWSFSALLQLFSVYVATLSKNNFNFHYVIGRGGFGKVRARSVHDYSMSDFVFNFAKCLGLESRIS